MDTTEPSERQSGSDDGPQLSVQDMALLTSDEIQQFYTNALDEGYSTGVTVSPPPLAYLCNMQGVDVQLPPPPLAPAPDVPYEMDTFDLSRVGELYISGGPPALSMEQLASQPYLSPLLPVSEGYPGSSADAFVFSMDESQPPMYIEYSLAQQEEPAAAQQSVSWEEQFFEAYQRQIHTIFTLAHQGNLRDIGVNLLDASHHLLGNVEALGLTQDDQALNNDRLRLWNEFNCSWLVTLQKQLDLTKQDHPLLETESIMSAQMLERLSTELVRLCDGIERFGLVDYQMGVEEEDIMDILLRCLDALDVAEPAAG